MQPASASASEGGPRVAPPLRGTQGRLPNVSPLPGDSKAPVALVHAVAGRGRKRLLPRVCVASKAVSRSPNHAAQSGQDTGSSILVPAVMLVGSVEIPVAFCGFGYTCALGCEPVQIAIGLRGYVVLW